MTRQPYRIAVWGPGTLGSCAIREIHRLPETELVAVLVYSESKHGVDVGTLVEQREYGLLASSNPDDLINAKPECVIYTARDYGDFRADDDIAMLLEAGINVLTPQPYQYPKMRGDEVFKKLENAGKKGNATLFGTGVNPGFMYERLAAVLTGISNDIESISLREFFNAEHLVDAAEMLELFGFGLTEEQVRLNPAAAHLAESYLKADIFYLADMLGLSLDKVERVSDHAIAKNDIDVSGLINIKAGTLGKIAYRWIGYTNGKPFFSVEVNWCMTKAMMPPEAKGDDYWLIEIEGQPSSRVGVEIQGSFKRNKLLLENNPAPGAYFATVIPMCQAIPHVISAPPGIMIPEMPQIHWKPDMRN